MLPSPFSIRSFSIYFSIEAQNVSMLSVSFPCEKVCIRKPRILATLPKSPSSPPAASAPVQKNPHFCSYILPFHCTLKFRCAIIMSIREGAAIAGGKMEVFYYGSFRGRAEHPAQGPCGTQRAGGHPALPGLSHSGLSPHCPLAVRAQALLPCPMGQPAGPA